MGSIYEQKNIIEGRFCVLLSGYDWKNVLWEVVNDYAVEEGSENNEIGLRMFGLIFLKKTRRGGG